jgi:hypothetical protein
LTEIIANPKILAAFIGGLILIQVHKFIAFRSAANKFAGIFLQELKDIYPKPVNWPKETFKHNVGSPLKFAKKK